LSRTCSYIIPINNKKIWIISEGRYADIDPREVFDGNVSGPCKKYEISDIGCYLLDPHSIEIKKRLVGGEIHYKQGVLKKTRTLFRRLLLNSWKRRKNSMLSPEVILSRYKLRIPPLKDFHFEAHLNHICGQLKGYDGVAKRLAQLDPHKIFQVVGICEDIGGNYSYLKLQGTIEEKIKYLEGFISKDVGVIINKAYIADGLYELRGYDFPSYEPAKSYRLVSYQKDGITKACVLTEHNQVLFHIDDLHLVKQMLLLEQVLKANSSLQKAFSMCTEGRATAIKLFFNKKLEIDYSKTALPAIYQDLFKELDVKFDQRNLIKPVLNYLQTGISLNYVLPTDNREDRMLTNISVLHDFRALEPLRKNLPNVYSAMLEQAFVSEAGRFYLLDSINGYSNAQ
jgi:hypothetical protein